MKIALCFLTYSDLTQSEMWKYFINKTEYYNCYIHNKYDFDSYFRQFSIANIVVTEYGKISIVKATLELFKAAYENEDNEYFVLLSDSCIPLYGPTKIYKEITSKKTNIITNYFSAECIRYNTLFLKEFFQQNKFSKQQQWMCLTRDTVGFFITNDLTDVFGENCEVPDEHYFINIINKFNLGYTNKRLTFVNWKERSDSVYHRPLPKTYIRGTDEIINQMRNSGCLFSRKIAKNCTFPTSFLMEIKQDNT